MAVLKKIKFGTGEATPIAQTVVTAASESVLSVAGTNTGIDDNDNPSYAVDLNISADGTLVKDTTGQQAVLKVGTVPAAQVSVADSGDKFTGTDVETVLAELDSKITSTGNTAKKYKVVAVDSPAGTSLAEYKLQVAEGTSETYSDVTGSSTIVVPKDNAFVTAQLGHVGATVDASTGTITDGSGADALLIEYVNGSGVYTLVAVPLGDFLREAEFKDGLAVSANGEVSAKLGQGLEFGGETGENKSINVKIDSTSADAEGFLSVGANGVKISGVQDAIDTAIQALDVTTDTAVAGQYVAAIQEADGVVSVKTRANVSEAVLNNYAKGSDGAAVAATDTINQAISKLENQVDAAKQAATAGHSVVAKDTNAGHLTLSESTDSTTGQKTYTIGEKDIASASDLTAEVNRAKSAETAIDTAVGLTKDANGEGRTWTPTSNYGGTTASVKDNMQALDAQLKTVSDNLAAVKYKVTGTTLEFFGIDEKTGA